MSKHDEEDPKKPRPVRVFRKRSGGAEAREAPWRLVRKDDDRDHHRHVV